MNENTVQAIFWICLASVLISIILVCAINISENNVLISKQTTCYGKALQANSSTTSSDVTIQLQACNGK